jgi:hypothetical protein
MDQNTTKSADDIAAERPVKAMAVPNKPAKRLPIGLTDDEDHGVILSLGSALVLMWEEIPQDLQRKLFDVAADVMVSDRSSRLREQLARFLHDHKDDT